MFAKLAASRRVSILVALLVALYGVSATGQSAAAPLTLTTAPASQKASASVAAPAAEEESAPLKNDASHQGVKVHGHWKIVVKNPDGSIDHTTEFENSLTSTGQIFLAAVVYGGNSPGGLLIDLQSTGNSICGKANCDIVTNTSVGAGYAACVQSNVVCAAGMTQTLAGGSIVLAGQMTASQAGTVTSVMTLLGSCPGTFTPSACAYTTPTAGNGINPANSQFTLATLPSAVSVNANQIVQVSVTISFS